jgi:hypothetical protein
MNNVSNLSFQAGDYEECYMWGCTIYSDQLLLSNKIKEDEMGRKYSKYSREVIENS